ncbi:GNAT family N-acetyltransferase [Jiella marina]|uniref:GNAT family N-acetyltransferase n=1 Tax=Jiella sp. LLJ827 TaxID=2917712 RepID=UPI0021009297|nr:N-acetyltransferase [Jiella sp. LLJ827]MCQ0987900.1 N-acetyltransferase [Jiella sp. LLJ827]
MDRPLRIRPETHADVEVIRVLIEKAFHDVSHSDHKEAEIVDELRRTGALGLSLVAIDADGGIMGHIAFSAVSIEDAESGWYGLGPVAVWPELQRQGLGTALVNEGLRRLEGQGAKGCVVLGDPAFYSRFGFASDPALTYRGLPTRYVQKLAFQPQEATGEISYHAAFDAAA